MPTKQDDGVDLPDDWLDRCEEILMRYSLVALYRHATRETGILAENEQNQ
ncbi:MAG TPA: hypothetical protein VJ792_06685 [Candidatus Nitrosotalea sp.]|nr:hypothetical protein [Candidatus Nitrosotalea sp.]